MLVQPGSDTLKDPAHTFREGKSIRILSAASQACKLRFTPPRLVVKAHLAAERAELRISFDEIESDTLLELMLGRSAVTAITFLRTARKDSRPIFQSCAKTRSMRRCIRS